MKKSLVKKLLTLFILFFSLTGLYAQKVSGAHRGKITSLVHNGNTVISAGEDGFIVTWDTREKAAVERFQLTPYSIQAMVKHPSRAEICIVEAAGINDYRISVWNYIFKDRLFSIKSSEPVTFVNYSAAGSLIIASGFNGSPLTLLDAGTGEIITSPGIPQGTVALALTGRSEKSMLLYQAAAENGGQLLYLDLEENAADTVNFQTYDNLFNSIIFGNNRFIAGTNSGGLFVIDAASGSEFANLKNIERNALLCPAEDGFFCLSKRGRTLVLYRFSLDSGGRLVTRQELSLSIEASVSISAIAYNGNIALASADGKLLLPEQNGNAVAMAHNFQTRTGDIAASFSSVGILTENGELCFLPLDYRLLEDGAALRLEKKTGFTQISSVEHLGDQFILWQKTNTRYVPQIVYSDHKTNELNLKFMLGRFPLRMVSSARGKILVLDSSGNLSVYNAQNLSSKADFTFFSMGAISADFIDTENLILCRSVISGNSPFLFVNTKTGETVPFPYPAQAGIMVYAGKAGNVYAAAVEKADDGVKTIVMKLSPSAGSVSAAKIFEYSGEDANLSVVESGGRLAVSCGSEGAAIYGGEAVYFERTEGLPVKLVESEKFFLCADSEGNISWHDNKTGKLLAVFKLYEDRWTLKSDKEITGEFTRP
jgi:hypothetical protein